MTFFSGKSTCTYTLQTVTISKISGKMRPTGCFQTNHSKHKRSCNFVHWHAKNTWFLVQKSQIVSKNHDNVVSIVLYWTFLGLSAPYEVVERSCAFFCILIYFTRYKMYMCVGIGWSLNLLPFSNQLPSSAKNWDPEPMIFRFSSQYLTVLWRPWKKCVQNNIITFDLIILVYWYTKTHNVIDVGAGDLWLQFLVH